MLQIHKVFISELSYFQSIIRTLEAKSLPENNQEIISEHKPQQAAEKTATEI